MAGSNGSGMVLEVCAKLKHVDRRLAYSILAGLIAWLQFGSDIDEINLR